MATQTIILICVFAYFAVGGMFATAISALSLGFSGKFEPLAIVVFFFWPVYLIARIPYIFFIITGVGGALVMTGVAFLILRIWIDQQ